MGKDIVPELIQSKFNVDNICYETEKLLYDKTCRDEMINELGKVKEKLSDKYSAQVAAETISTMLNS